MKLFPTLRKRIQSNRKMIQLLLKRVHGQDAKIEALARFLEVDFEESPGFAVKKTKSINNI
ncbi:MAG: hypothetical protein PHN44_04510 [Candidatus Marinimicrobia bacterium]|nr:hypothetical protein [Candidatus Neomarinimicrobiota bacterium]MDD5540243.1 hypothetical protein [Candidatus Neomarinimicrobiota bacterium]